MELTVGLSRGSVNVYTSPDLATKLEGHLFWWIQVFALSMSLFFPLKVDRKFYIMTGAPSSRVFSGIQVQSCLSH